MKVPKFQNETEEADWWFSARHNLQFGEGAEIEFSTDDGTRYVKRGKTRAGRPLIVVWRLTEDAMIHIIAAWEVEQ